MDKQIKSNWQTIGFVAIATLTILFAAQSQVAAQGTTQSRRFTFNHLFLTPTSHNLRLNNAAGIFGLKGIMPERKFGTNFNFDEYPEPDFSAMTKWYEIVKYEYDFFTDPLLPRLYFVVKPKVENPPTTFKMKFADADGVALNNYAVFGIRRPITVGEPQRLYGMAPKEKDMPKVRSIVISRIVE